ncbi:universal stress protein [Candidatus Nitrospira bockiana]
MSRILLATDFSAPARRAYTYALRMAQVFATDVTILHVLKAPPGFDAATSGTTSSRLDDENTHALVELGRMLRVADEHAVKAEHRVIVGAPDQAILQIAEEIGAGMISMGTHGRTGYDRLQFGSTAASIVRQARCPVLTVHAGIVGDLPMTVRRLRLANILVAIDVDADSHAAALRCASALATRVQARMRLVHAADDVTVSSPAREAVHQHASVPYVPPELRAAVSVVKDMGIGAEAVCAPGRPVDVILKEAASFMADLLVMGTRRTTALGRLALGSVADSVIRRAGCPVLVVKDESQ